MAGILLALLAPPLAGLALWLYAGSHQVLPGLDGCGKVRDREAQIDCYSGQFRSLVDEQGLAQTVSQVDRATQQDASLRASCHLAWHPVGERDGRRAAKDDKPFPDVPETSFCQQGYVHGVTIGYLDADKDPSADDAVTACGEKASDEIPACVHGFGHAFTRAANYDDAEAVETCLELEAQGALPKESALDATDECMYAVYMELAIRDTGRDEPGALNNCIDAPKEARGSCIKFLPARVEALSKDADAVVGACKEFAVEQDRALCARSVGMGLANAEPCEAFNSPALRTLCVDAAKD